MGNGLLERVGEMNFRGGQIPQEVYQTYLVGKTKPRAGDNATSANYDCDCIDCADCDCDDCPV